MHLVFHLSFLHFLSSAHLLPYKNHVIFSFLGCEFLASDKVMIKLVAKHKLPQNTCVYQTDNMPRPYATPS